MIVHGNTPPTNLPGKLLTTGVAPGETITFIGAFLAWNALAPVVPNLILDLTAATFANGITLSGWTLPATLIGGHFQKDVLASKCSNITIAAGTYTLHARIQLRTGSNLTVRDNNLLNASALYVDQINGFAITGNRVLEPQNDGIFLNASSNGSIARNTIYSPSRLTTSHPDGIQITNALGPGHDCHDIEIADNVIIGPEMQGEYTGTGAPYAITVTRNYIRVGYKWANGWNKSNGVSFIENDYGPFDASVRGKVFIDFRNAQQPPTYANRGNIMNGVPMSDADFVFA